MAWEWLSPTAGAAVAIAGMGFGYLTSRKGDDAHARESEAGLKHERDLLERSERRDAFALFLAALDGFDRSVYDTGQALKKNYDEGDTSSVTSNETSLSHIMTMRERFNEVNKHYQYVLLYGSTGVRNAARDVREDVLDAWKAAVEQDRAPRFLAAGPRAALAAAMREDLGYSD